MLGSVCSCDHFMRIIKTCNSLLNDFPSHLYGQTLSAGDTLKSELQAIILTVWIFALLKLSLASNVLLSRCFVRHLSRCAVRVLLSWLVSALVALLQVLCCRVSCLFLMIEYHRLLWLVNNFLWIFINLFYMACNAVILAFKAFLWFYGIYVG